MDIDPPLPPSHVPVMYHGGFEARDVPLPTSPTAEKPDPLDPFRNVSITNPDYKLHPERIHHRNKHDHHGKPRVEDNVPDRFELFTLGEGEKKIEEVPDTRNPSTSIFYVNKEDHTLGNLLRDQLRKNRHVVFSAYKVPHPLFSKFELRVSTDAEITPRAAVIQASRELINDFSTLSREFAKEWELRKMAGAGASAGNNA